MWRDLHFFHVPYVLCAVWAAKCWYHCRRRRCRSKLNIRQVLVLRNSMYLQRKSRMQNDKMCRSSIWCHATTTKSTAKIMMIYVFAGQMEAKHIQWKNEKSPHRRAYTLSEYCDWNGFEFAWLHAIRIKRIIIRNEDKKWNRNNL